MCLEIQPLKKRSEGQMRLLGGAIVRVTSVLKKEEET